MDAFIHPVFLAAVIFVILARRIFRFGLSTFIYVVLITFVFPIAGVVLTFLISAFCLYNNPAVLQHHAPPEHEVDPVHQPAPRDSIDKLGRDAKSLLDSAWKKDKARADRARLLYCAEQTGPPEYLSRSQCKLASVLSKSKLPWSNKSSLRFADLGSGRGGWTDEILNRFPKATGIAVSIWDINPSHEEYHGNKNDPRMELISGTVGSVEPRKVDLILSDMGEAQDTHEQAVRNCSSKLSQLLPWLAANPGAKVFIKIMHPYSSEILSIVESWSVFIPGLHFYRSPESRSSALELYATNLPVFSPPRGSLEEQLVGHFQAWKKNWQRAWNAAEHAPSTLVPVRPVRYYAPPATIPSAHFPYQLDKLDFSRSTEVYLDSRELFPPRQHLSFLSEVGWFAHRPRSAGFAISNPVISGILAEVAGVPGIVEPYAATNIDDKHFYMMLKRKIDTVPQPDKELLPILDQVFQAFEQFVKSKNFSASTTPFDEIPSRINRASSVGHVLSKKYTSLGDYVDGPDWRKETEQAIDDWLQGHGRLTETFGKLEKKAMKTGETRADPARMISCYDAPGRLAEVHALNFVQDLVKCFPFTVSGLPIYDYGEHAAHLFADDDLLLEWDVSAFDTRVSRELLFFELRLLLSVCHKERHRSLVSAIYRNYAHKRLVVGRHVGGKTEGVLIDMEGQRGSGEVVTYSLNSISNAAVILASIAHIENIPLQEITKWTLKILKGSKEPALPRLIVSGDDSIVGASRQLAPKIATQIEEVMTRFDFPLKDTRSKQKVPETSVLPRIRLKDGTWKTPLPIIPKSDLSTVSFCSHTWPVVSFSDGSSVYRRRMPYRPPAEVFGKLGLILSRVESAATAGALARATAASALASYPHVSRVAFVARAIFSVTDVHSALLSKDTQPRWTPAPWLGAKHAEDVMRICLCEGSLYPLPSPDFRPTMITEKPSPAWANWKSSIGGVMREVRKQLSMRVPNAVFENGFVDTGFDPWIDAKPIPFSLKAHVDNRFSAFDLQIKFKPP